MESFHYIQLVAGCKTRVCVAKQQVMYAQSACLHISMRMYIPLCTAVSPYKLVRRAVVYPQVRCCVLFVVDSCHPKRTLFSHCTVHGSHMREPIPV